MALSISPSAVWELNESSGTLADATGNGFTMTTHNSPTYSSAGKVGTSLLFTAASSQYADATHSATLNSASYSVAAWIKKASNPTEEYILAHDGTALITTPSATTNTTGGTSTTSFNNAAVAAGSFVRVKTTAMSGTVDFAEITIIYN